jgi:cytochrome oxidase Cu insertion factor (SCO1/SenC/PrrC family)
MKRCAAVAKELARETTPPLDANIVTRNAMAGIEPVNWDSVPWIREFFLTDQTGKKLFSRDLTGEVWLASFFFSTCPGICIKQNQYLSALQERMGDRKTKFVSITTDPQTDTPAVLADYARRLHAQPDRWLFCSANEKLTRRIAGEFFKASVGGDHHTSRLFVVDRWGQVRGSFDWEHPEQESQLLALIDQCAEEPAPVSKFKVIEP